MKFRLFSEGPIGDEERFVITLQQRVKDGEQYLYGHVGEFEISGRELKQLRAALDNMFAVANELPTMQLQTLEKKNEDTNIR